MVFLFRLFRKSAACAVAHALGGGSAAGLSGCRRPIAGTCGKTWRRPVSPDLRRAAAAEAGKQMLELARIWLRRVALEVAVRVVPKSPAGSTSRRHGGRQGIVFLTPHLGCFEITAQYYVGLWRHHGALPATEAAFLQNLILAAASAPTFIWHRPMSPVCGR
jgi:KDO2-lipid IV(A) lauroyltransferase